MLTSWRAPANDDIGYMQYMDVEVVAYACFVRGSDKYIRFALQIIRFKKNINYVMYRGIVSIEINDS